MDKNVPEIRFKEFNENWKERRLDSVYSKIRNAFVGTATPYYVKDGNFYLESNNVKDGRINRRKEVFINDEFYYKQSDKWLKEDDIVMVQSGHVGHTAVIPPELNNIAAHALIMFTAPKEKVSPHFLNFQFQNDRIKAKLSSITTGNTIKHILSSEMKEFELSFTNCDEQIEIGNCFQKLDTLINQHRQKQDKLSNLKKAMLEKMFPKAGESVPEIRFDGFSGDWVEVTLGKNARFTKGQGYSKRDLAESGTPIILYGRLYTKYQTVISQVDTFSEEKPKSLKSIGTEVIVPASGESPEDIARASAVSKSGVILGGDLNVIYPNDKIAPNFLALTISHGTPQRDLSSKAQGKSVVHIRNSDLQSLILKIPELNEQKAISSYFQKLDTLINQHQKQITKLKNIKQACLDKMFV